MVSMLAIGPKVCGFKPSQERWIFKGNENLQHACLQREVKLSTTLLFVTFYSMLKTPSKYERRYFISPNPSFPLPVPPALLVDDFAGMIARKLWQTNQGFPLSISFHHGFPCS
jgi:hypothetical protein